MVWPDGIGTYRGGTHNSEGGMTYDKPEYGKQYRLTGATGTPAISNGNTWAESEVSAFCPKCREDMRDDDHDCNRI